ncbi:class I SAM-dependent methyltransferase [Gordonia sp. ABSL1-1]|uniref:class I SAM-dependent methyltransferase n=1 Tax=Gordonia sp. ABSL1-1 TaxID=3053923 RepID=UPI0025747AF6|nr:class I SAM-dependent methyltransferase [Gordonia sp. ABSL1-1]MDL9936905.1 class I SAM-dependent methyltransferase [Gordonia sp. ABSL1-1]
MNEGHHNHHSQHVSGESTPMTALARIFDLDAAVTGAYLDDAIDLIRAARSHEPAVVVDLGAGTGSATTRLAARFPSATIVAVDNSPTFADQVVRRAATDGWSSRLTTVAADLDDGWPVAVGTPDVVWASSSMHHAADPARLLREMYARLADDGTLAVLEIEGPPRFLPADQGIGTPGFEDRIVDLLTRSGWNTHPDWTVPLTEAGFGRVTRTSIRVEPATAPPGTAEYAVEWYAHLRDGIGRELPGTDRAILDQLLSHDHPQSLHARPDLRLRAGRLLWLAQPNAEGAHHV